MSAMGARVLLNGATHIASLEKMLPSGSACTNASTTCSSAGDSEGAKDAAFSECSVSMRVKNTFLEFPVEHLLWFDSSLRQRRTRSCPGRVVIGDGSETAKAVAVGGCSGFAASVADQLQGKQPPPLCPATSAAASLPSLPQLPPTPARWPSTTEAACIESCMYPNGAIQNTAKVVLNTVINRTTEKETLIDGFVNQEGVWSQSSSFLPNAPSMASGFPGVEETTMSVVWAECRASIANHGAVTAQNTCALVAGPKVQQRPPKQWELGSPELPTVGSAGHHLGKCKPCAFVHRKGCDNGVHCQFCHICDSEEKKRRQKEKWDKKRHQWRQRRLRQRQETNGWQGSSETAGARSHLCRLDSPRSCGSDNSTMGI